ncbi:hypothetical protein [Bacteroides acidifaciens]|uniref:hypothetical protein n=1 Tax=Bacteroides acidifaciens TaxID=85831 RepID=UPI0026755A26|nr:hypothetical protein [Bacteroides acidifaciens]
MGLNCIAETPFGASPGAALPGLTMAGLKGDNENAGQRMDPQQRPRDQRQPAGWADLRRPDFGGSLQLPDYQSGCGSRGAEPNHGDPAAGHDVPAGEEHGHNHG